MRSLYAAADVAVIAGWIVLAGALGLRRRGQQRRREVRRSSSWRTGLLLQAAGIGLLFAVRRPFYTPFAGAAPYAGGALAAAAIGLTIASVWFMIAAQWALGAQFAYQARLVEGHRLVREGPYRFVRHPIYSGLLGLSLATGLALSRWPALVAFAVLYAAGTRLRMRAEESLLREAFGEEFEQYRRTVPAILPGRF